MPGANRKVQRLWAALLLSSTFLVPALPVMAQQSGNDAAALAATVPADAKMLLSANELVYNKDADRVIVRGAVQINYGGYQMVARQVEYNQKSGRIIATGEIELIEPSGNKVYADHMDVTSTFSDGFVQTMRVETTDLTKLAAVNGERRNGNEFILNQAVYTACTPCATDPNHRSLWNIKAERIIQNGTTHTIRLEKAHFELFGQPIIYLPAIEVPDQTVKRQSGFLFPRFRYTQKLGFGASVPYYWAIAPDMDATVTATGLTRQGFLLEGEFRQRFEMGEHVLRMAGISQMNPESFTSGTEDADHTQRGMIASKADFQFNPRWSFGWDVLVQSDNNFAKTYDLSTFDGTTLTNQAYLTGLGDRNYFDLRAFYFDIQDADPSSAAENQQAIAQVLDYSATAPNPVAGGELSATINLTNIKRNRLDAYTVANDERFRGLEGTDHRLTAELEWKKQIVVPGGLVLTPLLAARGDAIGINVDRPVGYSGDFTNDDAVTRGMVTAGLEARYPMLFTTPHSSHILEPIAQIFVRPNEQYAGGLPNEDAQSFVFDATTLFDRDKFSGFDRIEGGTRANLGIRYTGTLGNGYGVRAIAGQSYQLGGVNSFATDDLVNAGANSGLETDRSDYVALVGLDAPSGFTGSFSGRFDKDEFSLKRTDLSAGYEGIRWQTAVTYTSIKAQPLYGTNYDQDEIKTAASYRFQDYWSVFGSVTYDLNYNVVTRNSLGITYDDQDTVFSLVYKNERDPDQQLANDWSIGARISFRTLGDINVGDASFKDLD
ncbi:Organic solvent tolerance protein [Xaviernesmea oryzae]|uniref:LPS-assembly protein LptD n=1 Tax=Xaviernesmea oryzae TaxID=464029 RepID=A0A1Q9AT22_9HYPH|nr:LPS-assembly protein LptD [Xaviernesmea oryzae]OLP58538.1 Organic solvent tolerance protein [Xaviernesmea oryzae]SEK61140.1 LPS-assembly protein [Xaviernesmea oryzae]